MLTLFIILKSVHATAIYFSTDIENYLDFNVLGSLILFAKSVCFDFKESQLPDNMHGLLLNIFIAFVFAKYIFVIC